jgi:hypothetical protein
MKRSLAAVVGVTAAISLVLTGCSGGGSGVRRRPVIFGEDKCGEVDFVRKFDQTIEGGCPRMERGRPGINVRHILETARQILKQLRLLSRRP